jgi:hypothetical protein
MEGKGGKIFGCVDIPARARRIVKPHRGAGSTRGGEVALEAAEAK